jgi:hypothetical protein
MGMRSPATSRGTPLPSQRVKVWDRAWPTRSSSPIRRDTCAVTAVWLRNEASTALARLRMIPAAACIRAGAERPAPARPST